MPIGTSWPKTKSEIEKGERLHARLGPVGYWAWSGIKAAGLMTGGVLACLILGAALLAGIAGGADLFQWLGWEL